MTNYAKFWYWIRQFEYFFRNKVKKKYIENEIYLKSKTSRYDFFKIYSK